MRKLLLTSAAVAGLALASSPAHAQVDLDLGGFFMGYGVWQDSDETNTAGAGDEYRDIDLRRRSEVHFTGETTLDNGLTVGVHNELVFGDEANDNQTDETYAYLSGSWGRVNVGVEDGAAYLLQVAAPSADSNVDGLRVHIQAVDLGVGPAGAGGLAEPLFTARNYRLDYDNAPFEDAERITYLSPKFSGFQGGISYAPELNEGGALTSMDALRDGAAGSGFGIPTTNDDVGHFEDSWEVAGRWDGEFEGVGVSAGLGYVHASTETDAAAALVGSDDLESWDAGVNVSFGAFSAGGAYLTSNNGIQTSGDSDTWVVGADWTNGPWTAGVSWLDAEHEVNVFGAGGGDVELQRIAVGGTYAYGPGMTFRGAVAFGESEDTSGSSDFSQVTLGTQIDF